MRIKFSKYEGAGNDFILIDDRALVFPTADSSFIQRLCHRHFGVGADGVILLQPSYRMRIFNPDGQEAEACGNGTRCFVRFMADLGLRQDPYPITIGNRQIQAFDLGEVVAVEMGEMKDRRCFLPIEQKEIHFLNSGVPHAVWFVSDVDAIPLEQMGPLLRHHPVFAPHGTNVNIASLQKDGSVCVRTYERGVEAETLACGTGGTAVALLGAHLFGWKSPVRIRFPGGDLAIYFDEDLAHVKMAGPVRKVFEGFVLNC